MTSIAHVARALCLVVVVGSVVGLIGSSIPAQTADAADSADSSLTVKWTDDTGVARGLQPPRSSASPHFAELKNISITVSQTQDLIDQAVRVSFSGFSGGSLGRTDATGRTWNTAMNFMQAMQCWGDPAAEDFRTTCQWGGKYGANNGLSSVVYDDNLLRIDGADLSPTAVNALDVPLKTPGGLEISGRMQSTPGGLAYPLFTVTSPATTNEVVAARVKGDGTGYFDFEAQTADQAPQLGCGREGHLSCYLVLVPRGTVFGGTTSKCSGIFDNNFNLYTYGRPASIQAGSPLNPACDYWDNRIVVPLDFSPVGRTCESGAPEQRVVGSQLLVGAMASWQLALCTSAGATFSFATNPDSIGRLQLLDGQAELAFGSRPIVKSELNDPVAESEVDGAVVSYAPIAVGGIAFAFFAEGPQGRIDTLRLTPRLVAKLLTQSYVFEVPYTSSAPQDNIAHLPAINRGYSYWAYDPDFQAANPNWEQFTFNPALVLPGPAGADAIRELWAWILSDQEARAWLDGAPDPWGMTINPYYLPFGHPDAKVPVFDDRGLRVLDDSGAQVMQAVGMRNPDGTPMKLTTAPLDYFLKADETQVPFQLTTESRRFDSIQAFPYSDSLLTAARDSFRADPKSKVAWDPNKATDAGTGDWVSVGPQALGTRFMIAVTDVASARRYALDTADLRLASGEWTTADDESMAAALAAATPVDGSTLVMHVDPAKMRGPAYPLTSIVYSVTNLSVTTAASRSRIAKFVRFAVTDGQKRGVRVGDLPPGYVPLSADLVSRALAASTAIEGYTSTQSPSDPPIAPDLGGGFGGGEVPTQTPAATSEPEVAELPETIAAKTPVAQPAGRIGLAGSLGLGLLGTLIAPVVLRGRRSL